MVGPLLSARFEAPLKLVTVLSMVLALAAPFAQPTPTYALSIGSAAFDKAYVKPGAALTLTVMTSNDVNCVVVSGAHAGTRTGSSTRWVFNFTAAASQGSKTVSVSAYKNTNCQSNGNSQNVVTGAASYIIDGTPPTISATRAPAANANGWNNSSVTVSFACADSSGGSGIKSCSGSQTVTANAANQSVSGTAIDNADNSASTTVSGINVDQVAPTLSGVATTAPNANGWYKSDVVIAWSAADALSGLVAAPASSTISGEGSSLTASASVGDKAGNTTTALSPAVKSDRTAPKTVATAPSAWNNSDVTLSLNADDALSGVKATYFKLNGGAQQTGSSTTIDAEGVHTLEFWSEDNAGNTEAAQSVTVKIDKSAPTISHTQSPAANGNGWNNGNVTVTFICNDSLSGIASCTAPQTVTTEGKNQAVSGTAIDNAGNSATDPATVSIDKSAPTISGTRTPAANANGWNNTPVTITWTCADALSGTDTCPGAQTRQEGANQSVSGSVVDAAGNSATATVSGIHVDLTDPALSGAATTAPNVNGWYNADVTIAWTCADALSGIEGSCPETNTIAGEGANLSAVQSVSDKAGNQTTRTAGGIKIDRTSPNTIANAPLGWQSSDVVVSFDASDNLSGINATYFKVDGGTQQSDTSLTISSEGVHSVQFWSVDQAGNVEAPQTITVNVDKTGPTISGMAITAPNANGWYNGPVTVRFTCIDVLSGIATCPADVTLTTDGASQSVSGTATDNAGNTATATVQINLDSTGPAIAIKGIADKAVYTLGAVPAASCTATDSTSGLAAACSGSTTGGTANGVGSFTYTATATDKAGNTTTQSVTYRVIYRFDGFLQPINDTAHQVGTSTSIFKAGSTVPVKLQLKRADGSVVQTTSAPLWPVPVKGSAMAAPVDETVYGDAPNSGTSYRWDATSQQYIYNWSTKGQAAGYYYRIGVTLDDGQTYYVNIGLR